MGHPKRTTLNPSLRSIGIDEIHNRLSSTVIGQSEAVDKVTQVIEIYKAGLSHPNKPISNILCLGPTGTGKTKLVEGLCEVLFGDEKHFLKIDCGEFSGSNSTSSFVGAPPGYIGHNTSELVITQAKLEKFKTEDWPVSIILFDEIEKASESLYQLMLGILDKASLKTNSGDVIDFSNSIIFMTSNLGAEKMSSVASLGFIQENKDAIKSENAAIKAVEKKFSPEFFNRIDHSVVFKPLTQESLDLILDLELAKVRKRIFQAKAPNKFTFLCTTQARELILQEGFNGKYGARQLKRTIEKYVTNPLSSLMMTEQVEFGDLVVLSILDSQIAYEKLDSSDIYELGSEEWNEFKIKLMTLEINNDADGMVAGAS